jgi:hypothetical protein
VSASGRRCDFGVDDDGAHSSTDDLRAAFIDFRAVFDVALAGVAPARES